MTLSLRFTHNITPTISECFVVCNHPNMGAYKIEVDIRTCDVLKRQIRAGKLDGFNLAFYYFSLVSGLSRI